MKGSFSRHDVVRLLVCLMSVVVGVALAQRDANMTYAAMCRAAYPVYSGVAEYSLFEDVPAPATNGMPTSSCPEANLCRKNACMCLGLVFDAQTNQCIGAGAVTGNSRTLAGSESSSGAATLSCQAWSSRLHQALVGIAAGIPYNASSLSFSCRQSACYWITPDLAKCNWTTSVVCRTPAPEGYRGTLVLSGTYWDLVLKDAARVEILQTTLKSIIEQALNYECVLESLRVVDLDPPPGSTYGPQGLAVTFGVMAPRTTSLLDGLSRFVALQDEWIWLLQDLYRNWTASLGGNLETLRVIGIVEITISGAPMTIPQGPKTTISSEAGCGPACIGILVGIGILAVVAGVLGILYFSTKQRNDDRKGRYAVGLDSPEVPSQGVELEERNMPAQGSTRQSLPAYA